jgi:prepilin-type N-terminal cleavage/methylation domain-containing protein
MELSKPPFRFSLSPGFTLIEMAIVLVIIGLLVGGVLVGNDLIRAAGVRATISQIEKYNTAVNTFIGKYDAMPGDMNGQTATRYGFTPRGAFAGQGDGNGMLQGPSSWGAGGLYPGGGETGLFWVDLSTANGNNVNLIDGSFSTATITVPAATVTTATMSSYLPPAKLGKGNYVYVGSFNNDNNNYWGISVPSTIGTSGIMTSTPGLTVLQAYSIDTKIDDGVPLTGNVVAKYLPSNTWTTTANASPAVAADCFDSTTAAGAYAINVAGTASPCALSIKMQAGIGN